MDTYMLSVDKLQKYYGNKGNITKALDQISFHIKRGEFVGIMGPSGSGKTTLLNCISTIDSVSTGNIMVNGQDITQLSNTHLENFRKDQLGFIFQEFNLLDTLTGYENIALALSIQNKPLQEIERRIQKVARQLDIYEILEKYPCQMSGGEKQRIAAARALIKEPALILADEPTGSLDSRASRQLLELLEKINKIYCSTILMVTHDPLTASYAQRILFIKDGRIFNEIFRENLSRKEFFDRIIQVVTLLGGNSTNAL